MIDDTVIALVLGGTAGVVAVRLAISWWDFKTTRKELRLLRENLRRLEEIASAAERTEDASRRDGGRQAGSEGG